MKKIILDTDIGTDVDDAMALSLAALAPQLDIIGVTTVHADAPLRARVARKLLDLAGRGDIPVIAGASLPLQMPLPENFTWMPRLRGHEGVGILEGAELTPSKDPNTTADDAAKFIIEQAGQNQGELALITIGALTNVGRALQLEPRLAGWIHSLTLMGGTVYAEKFPFPPMLETNLNADPEAARLVFASGIPLTIVPMEVTTQVFLTPQQRQEMLQWNTPLATTLVALMEKMFEGLASLSAEAGLPDDFYQGRTFMHDPLAIYTAMAYQHVTTRRMHVAYEVIDRVVRTMPHFERTPNCWVCVDVDAARFVGYWLDQIHQAAC
ncbi:MAG: nucleoside hydrolase [Chloroflexi bacterium]|nr:MAG: nucleoside hydrolase [Chloroflexota bacterium]